ncbi:MAG: hypothetical protein ACRDND_08410 [Streptosporangiaceae bacterium]
MSSTKSLSAHHRNWSRVLRSAARTITSVVTECNQATRTMSQLRLAPDRYLPDSGQAPDDYAEFMFRTSGPLAHEPSARRRLAAGRGHR